VIVLVLLGVPGAGKGTQARLLSEVLHIPHISTGDLFRAAVRDGSAVGLEARRFMERGQLVPDGITIAMLLERLSQSDAANGAILDGFPRTRGQAEALDRALAERGARVDRALLVDVPADELVRRLTSRWVCESAGHLYNLLSNPPRVAGRCDLDDSPLVQRADDRPETVRARLEQQLGALEDVVEFYRSAGLLRTVDGLQPIPDVTAALLADLPGQGVSG
jgi:adenylate kinase